MVCSNKLSEKSKFFTILLVLAMAVDVYLLPFFPQVSFAELIIILVGLFLLVKKRLLYFSAIPNVLILFLLYSVIISLINAFLINGSEIDIFVRLLRDGVYWCFILLFCINLVDIKLFFKWVLIFCFILSLFIILQTVVFYSSGYFIPGFFLNALINDNQYYGYALYNHSLSIASYNYLRPNGFLCEPASCAQVLFIGLSIALNIKIKWGFKIFLGFLFSFAMVLTLSASAFVYVAFAWIIYLVANRKNLAKNLKMIFAVTLAFFLIVPFINNSGILFVFSRLKNLLSGAGDSETSTFLRIYRGFQDWSELPLFNKVFGAGFGSWDSANNLYHFSYKESHEYMSTISYILFSTGLPGFLMFLCLFVRLFRLGGKIGKIMVLSFFIVAIGSSIYSSFVFVWLMSIIMLSQRKTNVPIRNGVFAYAIPQCD